MRYQRLTLADRYQIMALIRSKLSVRAIATNLGRHPSTISREIRRCLSSRSNYRATVSHRQYLKRRSKVHRPLKVQGQLAETINFYLGKQWSPEQIAGRLKRAGVSISHETIYRYVYKNYQYGGKIYLNLRRRRRSRRSHKVCRSLKRSGVRANGNHMGLRPKIVEKRKRVGDYERDTVQGKFKGPVLLTIVDRVSRLTKIKKVQWINAKATHHATVELLQNLPVNTITNDNGSEFSEHRQTAEALAIEIYFNDPYSSWQRGTNENTNGLIRQYYPKGTDFTKVSDSEIEQLENLLNNRPRKCLGYRTPFEVQNSKVRVLR